jgi:hypothetical protein
MAQKPNRAAVTHFEVVFKEIDALYDLPGRERLVGSPNKPQVAIDNSFQDQLLIDRYRFPRFVDAMGEAIEDATSDVPGMYGAVRVQGYWPFWRGFSRKRAATIDKKYVYVFSADTVDGAGMALEYEIYLDKGELALVDLARNAKMDVRKPGKQKQKSVWLDVVRVKGGKPSVVFYFAILAPMQIPWQRLQDMLADKKTAARAQRVGDAFVTDGFTGGDPSKAKTLFELLKGNKPDALGFVLYLVDPLKEALQRFEPYQKCLDSWLAKQDETAKDDEYALAKRVQIFARGYKLEDLVASKLPAYLADKEGDIAKLRFATETACENMMRWVAYGHQHDRVGTTSDVCYRDGNGKQYTSAKSQPYSQEWVNPFTEAVRDYDGADEDTSKRVTQIVLCIHSRMAESRAGLNWMDKVFDGFLEEEFPVATAGAELLFEAKKKVASGSAEAWAKIFKHWAPIWTTKYRKDATKNIRNWLKATHDVEVEELSEAEFQRAWRAMKKGRKNLDGLTFLDSSKTKAAKLSKAGLDHLSLGFETFNLARAVVELKEHPDGWRTFKLLGAVGDFYGAAARFSEPLEKAEVTFKFAGVSRVLKVAPFMSVLAATVDFVAAGKELLEAKTTGERVGHSISTLGAALTVVASGAELLEGAGAASSEVGWGVPVMFVGAILQAGGAVTASNFAPANVFLRNCRWGTGGNWLQHKTDRFDDGDFYGYTGKLKDLGGDLKAQHEVLNELIYGYEPELEIKDEDSVILSKTLVLQMGTLKEDNPLNPASKWTIELTLDHKDGKLPERWTWKPDDLRSDEDASLNEELVVKAFTKMKGASEHDKAQGVLQVDGKAKLDPFGNGKYVLERPIKKAFVLSWQLR